MDRPRRLPLLALLAVILFAGITPYLFLVSIWPHSWDATAWIVRGAPTNPGWFEWVFETRQFNVGYRPVTGFSYTLDYALGGFSSVPYRLTDLALHLGAAFFVYRLYRRVAPELPGWGGLVAAGVFVAHPVTAEVLPHLARRSYSLSTFLALAALLTLCRAMPPPGRSSAPTGPLFLVAGGVLMGLGILANESAALIVAALPLVVLQGGAPREELRKRATPLAVAVIGCMLITLALRWLATRGGVGGYEVEFDRWSRIGPIALGVWRTLGGADALPGAAAPIGLVLLAGITLYYLWRSLSPRRDESGRRRASLFGPLIFWAGSYVVFFGLLGVWFPRQGYVALAPVALWIGALLADTFDRRMSPRARGWDLVPQLLLLGFILVQSPVVRGIDPQRAAAWRRTDAVLRSMHASIGELAQPATLQFAVPHFTRKAAGRALRAKARFERPEIPLYQVASWMRSLHAADELRIDGLLTFELHPLEPGVRPELRLEESRATLWMPAGLEFYTEAPTTRIGGADASTLALDFDPAPGGFPRYLYFDDGERATMLRLDGTGEER